MALSITRRIGLVAYLKKAQVAVRNAAPVVRAQRHCAVSADLKQSRLSLRNRRRKIACMHGKISGKKHGLTVNVPKAGNLL